MCKLNVNWMLISIYFLSFSSYASVSVIAPFFPSEAARKGLSTSLAGGVFSIFGVTLILMNAITGKILPLIGSKFTLIIGILIVGICNITFGLLDSIRDAEIFIVSCFIVRVFESIGVAFINTTIYMILIKKCGDNLSKVISINEACSSIGYTVGPPLGSLLYTIGGYKLPFLFLGTAVLLNTPISLKHIDNQKDFSINENQGENEKRLSYLKLFSMPKVIVICLTVFIVGNNYGVLASTLELYSENYLEIGPKYVGFMFMSLSASFTTFSLIIGKFFPQINGFKYFAFGLAINTFAFILISPSPFFVIQGNYITTALGLVVLGVGSAFSLIPTMPTILKMTVYDGYSSNITNSSCISGLWTTIFSAGQAFGPYFGALIFQYFDSQILFTAIAVTNLISSFASLKPLLNYKHIIEEKKRTDYKEIDGLSVQITNKDNSVQNVIKA